MSISISYYYIEPLSGKAKEIEITDDKISNEPWQILIEKGTNSLFEVQSIEFEKGKGLTSKGIYISSKFFNYQDSSELRLKVGKFIVNSIYRRKESVDESIEFEILFGELNSSESKTLICGSWEEGITKIASNSF